MLEKNLDGKTIFLRVDSDEEIISAVKTICTSHEIRSGRIEGIGTLKKATLGYYNGEKYEKIEVEGYTELISSLGDISLDGDEYVVHIHAVLGDEKGRAVVGHLLEGIVSFTGEFFVTAFPEKLERRYDSTTKLKLIE